MALLQGVFAPVLTPFQDDFSPDPVRLEHHCRWILEQGVGLVPFGTTSEANSLGTDERRSLLEHLVAAGLDPGRMLPGTGCCSLPESVALTRHAVELGCAGVLMLPPFYYKGVSDEGLYRHYASVIERVGEARLRLYLYHIPPVAQVGISVALIERLVRDFPETVVGIKDSSGDWSNTQAVLDAVRGSDFRVFPGSEAFLLRALRKGGAGCITATANVNPGPIRQLYEGWQAEDAEQRQAGIDRVRAIFSGRFPLIAAIKAALSEALGDPAWNRLRPPLVELSDAQRAKLGHALGRAGFAIAV
ncbi:MAG: dihydrodipicolinate synthase family protein [Gammaproteobacteria bacterium]